MATRDSTQKVLLRFWKVVETMHGLPTGDHKPSKSEAERMLSALVSDVDTDDEIMRRIRKDPTGAQSLFQVTFFKAALEGWAASNVKTPNVELKLRALAIFSFCTAAVIEFPYVKCKDLMNI